MQIVPISPEGPPFRADSLPQRVVLLVFLFAFFAVPLGLVGGAFVAVLLEGETVGSVLEGTVFLWPGLVLLGAPGVLLYAAVLEIGRRFRSVELPLLVVPLPLAIAGWAYFLGMPFLAAGAGSVTGTVALVSFGGAVVYCRARRVF